MAKQKWEDFSVYADNTVAPRNMAASYIGEKGTAADQISLNGIWKFHHQYVPSQLDLHCTQEAFDDTGWADLGVPSVWQMEGYSQPIYLSAGYPSVLGTDKNTIPQIDDARNEVGVYRRRFGVPAQWLCRSVYLRFDGVKSAMSLYCNGQYVGYSQGSMTGAEFDLTAYLHGETNQITVLVYRYSDGTYFEDQDMWFLSGIFRSVTLVSEPKAQVLDYYLDAEPDETLCVAEGMLHLVLVNRDETQQPIRVRALLQNKDREVLLAQMQDVLAPGEKKNCHFPVKVQDIELWSAENPVLYTLVLQVSACGETLCKRVRHGFRRIRIENGIFKINGRPVKLKGVNRHDFCSEGGWAVPYDTLVEDICLMKRSNINAVRTSHYPDSPAFYDLCDEYGLYVLSEADIETHGVSGITMGGMPPQDGFPGDREDVLPPLLDRLDRMIYRLRSHPCICIWSLGNESGRGSVFEKMYDHVRLLDPTRPVHYEGDRRPECSDFYSRMYLPAEGLAELAQGRDVTPDKIDMSQAVDTPLAVASAMFTIPAEEVKGRPLILCEYAHAMENSLGNFREYQEVFNAYDNVAGGFIWDFVDQSIHVRKDRKDQWLYGGDFGEKESSYYFCANGIVAGNRQPHPSLYEVKRGYQNVGFSMNEPGKLLVHNRFSFTNLNRYRLCWTLLLDGRIWKTGSLGEVDAEPGEEKVFCLPVPDLTGSAPMGEVLLNVELISETDERWAPAGYAIAQGQFLLKEAKPFKQRNSGSAGDSLKLMDKDGCIQIRNSRICAAVDTETGLLRQLQIDGEPLLSGPLAPNFYRALTDNDRGEANFNPPVLMDTVNPNHWDRVSREMRLEEISIREEERGLCVQSLLRHPLLKTLKMSCLVLPEGALELQMTATPVKEPYRIGLMGKLPGRYDRVEWYGRGPHENYCDRCMGADIGIYQASVADLEHAYMRPQENGTRTGVRSLRVYDRFGVGFLFTDLTGDAMSFSLHFYSQAALDAAEHQHELKREEDLTLNLDAKQCGVGGDLPGQAMLKKPYMIHPGETYTLHVSICRC